jgi:hypothetical protein
MNNRLFCIAVLILCLSSSITMALAPIGPPVVNLEKGQWSIGFDYSDTEIDFKLKNIQGTSFFTRNKANEVEIENTMGKLCYGINDNWQVFAGFGVAKAEYEEMVSCMDGGFLESTMIDYESDSGFAAQIGTKATFYEKGPLGLGALFQVNWATLDGTYAEATWTDGVFNDSGTGDLDADIMVFKFAPGASYKNHGNVTFYGGPLWQWIDGNGDADGQTGSLIGEGGKGDIRQDSTFGGWIGLQVNPDSDTVINIEFQKTGSSETFGFSFAKKF